MHLFVQVNLWFIFKESHRVVHFMSLDKLIMIYIHIFKETTWKVLTVAIPVT